MARASVTAGLRWAPESGPDMYAAVMTAKPPPKVMASQPALRALEAFRVTAAQTPPPSRMSMAVPMVSPMKMSELDTRDSFVLRPGEAEPRVPPGVWCPRGESDAGPWRCHTLTRFSARCSTMPTGGRESHPLPDGRQEVCCAKHDRYVASRSAPVRAARRGCRAGPGATPARGCAKGRYAGAYRPVRP